MTSNTAALAALFAAASLASPSTSDAGTTVEVHVRGVAGPLAPRALGRALPARRFIDCQRTFMGGSVWLTLRVSPEGALRVESARTSGEEVSPFVPCVRRVIRAINVGAQRAESVARVEVRFPALGVAPTR
ncbi:MAG: hypothetical protein U0326_35890 [Polyangiales bacterium]